MRATFVVGFLLVACASSPPAATSGGSAPAAAPAQAPSGVLASLAWMAGSWAGEVEPGVIVEESWMIPSGDMMLGSGRVTAAGRTVFFEHLRIEANALGAIAYVAMPKGGTAVSFPLVKQAPSEVVFENLQHDDPVRIIYKSEPPGLFARTESRDGKHEDFPMRRVAR